MTRYATISSTVPKQAAKTQVKKLVMAVNSNKPEQWKQDIAASVDMYNNWFMRSAPAAFRQTRERTTTDTRAYHKGSREYAYRDPESDQRGN